MRPDLTFDIVHRMDYVVRMALHPARPDQRSVIARSISTVINHSVLSLTGAHPNYGLKVTFKNAVPIDGIHYIRNYITLNSDKHQRPGYDRLWMNTLPNHIHPLTLAHHLYEMGDRVQLLKNCFVTLIIYQTN